MRAAWTVSSRRSASHPGHTRPRALERRERTTLRSGPSRLIRMLNGRSFALEPRRGLGFVHGDVGQPIRLRVQLPSDVLERDAVELRREQARARVERLEARVFDLEFAFHLVHEKQGVRADVDDALAARGRPCERREQAVVFGDVVGRDAERAVKLLDERAGGILDPHAVARRARIAPRAAVYVRGDQEACVAASGTKYRIRRQLSHWIRLSPRRTSLNICGRIRTWHTVQPPSRASATASPLRCFETCSKSLSASGESSFAAAVRAEDFSSAVRCSEVASASRFFRSAAIAACWVLSSVSAAFSSAERVSASSMRSRTRSSRDRIACSAVAISCSIVVYSLLVLSSSSCPLYLERRVWMVATSVSMAFRSVWLAARRCLAAATAAVACSSRAASASCTAGISAMRRRADSMSESSC